MRNLYKYGRQYAGADPEFVEGDVFRITVPLDENRILFLNDQQVSQQVSQQVNQQASRPADQQDRKQDIMEEKILAFCETARTRKEIADYCEYKDLRYVAGDVSDI